MLDIYRLASDVWGPRSGLGPSVVFGYFDPWLSGFVGGMRARHISHILGMEEATCHMSRCHAVIVALIAADLPGY